MKNNLKKIAVIGAESTGKSELCKALALHFDSYWCPEYAREYLQENGKNYSLQDLQKIAEGQIKLEEKYIAQSLSQQKEFLFIDTEMYNLKVWYEYVFNQCPFFILEEIVHRKYDYYLFTNIDLPWQKDDLREYPDLEIRQQLFHTYQDILINQNTGWHLVSGQGEERVKRAIAVIEKV